MLRDQLDILTAFNVHGVKYLVVGGHAVGIHAEPRGTKDLDIFLQANPENSEAVFRALAEFGAPLAGMTPADFSDTPAALYQIGVPPGRIDLLFEMNGVTFEEAWRNRIEEELADRVTAHVISKNDLIRNKLATGRLQDLADVEKIREAAQNDSREPI